MRKSPFCNPQRNTWLRQRPLRNAKSFVALKPWPGVIWGCPQYVACWKRLKKKADRPRWVGSRFKYQGNTSEACLGSHCTHPLNLRSLYRVLNWRHSPSPDNPNTTFLSQGHILGAVSRSREGKLSTHFKAQGMGEEPPIAQVQFVVQIRGDIFLMTIPNTIKWRLLGNGKFLRYICSFVCVSL